MPTQSDIELFRQAVKDVKPLSKRYLTHVAKTRKKITAKPRPVIVEAPSLELSDDNNSVVTADQSLFYAKNGLQRKVINHLRQGKISIDAVVDLHGMRVIDAKLVLRDFLLDCKGRRARIVLVIHGKGFAKLKSAVNTWLRNYPDTLAFCSAMPKDGGVGALYLLLKVNAI